MQKTLLSILLYGFILLQARGQSNPQVMMQGWYWDYPKTGQSTTGPGSVSFNWSDTLRLKAASLAQAGFTHVWYPPFAGNGNRSGGYDPRDLFVGPSQTSLGTLPEIKSMVNSMTAVGITPVADMVYNHRDGGAAEANSAVKDYITTFAGNSTNSGDNPNCGFKQPFPSDRYRMVIPLGGSASEGAGVYYIKMRSRNNIYDGHRYVFHATTGRIGGSRWNPVVTPEVNLTGSSDQFQYTAQLGRNYLNQINSNGDEDEFAVTVTSNDFTSTGDLLIIEAINVDISSPADGNPDYSNHLPIAIWFDPDGPAGSYNLADFTNPFGAGYKLQFQTYTNFNGMPSGRGALDWNGFRPHFTSSSRAGWSQSTCLGPAWSMQSLDYFYDYDHNITATKNLLVDWTKWAFDELGSKGLRVDAVKHFEPSFMRTMLEEMHASGRTPNLVVGEWYGTNRAELKGWVDAVYQGMNSSTSSNVDVKVFDFAMRESLKRALDHGQDPRNAYFNSLRFASTNNLLGKNIVTFLNNHDFRETPVSYDNSLVHNNHNLGYAWLLLNNQMGVPTVFYPDYYGYPARNTQYGNDIIGFPYHPVGLPALKTEIDNMIKVHKRYITNSAGMDLLNDFGGSTAQSGLNATVYQQSNPGKVLVYQLRPGGTVGNKEVIVAINFDNQTLRVDHLIKTPLPNGIATGTRFGDALGRSNFPFAVVDGQSRIYIDLPAKSYSVWVQDYVPLSVTLASTTACTGQSNTLTANLTGGTAPFTYSFSAGATAIPGSTSLASVTAAGPYSITVTDDFGVSVTATINSTFNPLPAATLLPVSNTLICAQPTVSLTAAGGTSNTLSNGLTNNTDGVFSLTQAGSYTVVVSTASGCTASATATVESNTTAPALTVSPSATAICVGASLTLTASGATTYTWTPGNTTGATLVVTPGNSITYTVTGTGTNGCTATAPASITANALPEFGAVTSTSVACFGGTGSFTVAASSGMAPYTFSLNTGSTNNDGQFAGLTAGSYTISLSDANGCRALSTTSVTIGQPTSALSATLLSSASAVCDGSSVTLTASASGGTSAYQYNFGGGTSGTSTSAVVPAIGNNTYSLTATDANGCTATASTAVQGNSLPTPGLVASGTLTCSVTAVTLTASGGNTGATLAYTFSGPGVVASSGSSATVNAEGTYSVTVLNTSTGCSNMTTVTVSSNTAAPGSASLSASNSGTLTCAVTTITLTGSATGSGLTYAFAGPTGPLTGSGNTLTVNAPGTYTVTISGSNGCSTTATTTLESNTTAPTLTVAPASGTVTCANPSLTLTASGTGTGYVWTGGTTGASLTVNAGGTYSVTATAPNGCTSTSSVTVSQDNSLPTPGLVASGTITCTQTAVTLTASGGDSYTFSGPGVVASSGSSATVNAEGTYSVTVLNASTGCSNMTTVTVSSNTAAPGSAALSASNSGTLTCSVTTLTLTTSATGSGLTYAFAGSAGALTGTGNALTVNTPGTYTVTITGTNGCTTSTTATVESNTTAPNTTLNTSQTLTCASPNLTLTATAGASYTLSDMQTNSTGLFSVSLPGTYTVVATGTNGCTASTTATVSSNTTAPTLTVNPASGTVTCANPSLTLTASGTGTGYVWTGGITGASLTVNAGGTYSVTATAANGCTSTSSVTVNQDNTLPIPGLVASGTLTCSVTAVTLTASGGDSYTFSGAGVVASSGNSATVNAEGTYSVTVLNASTGCSNQTTVTVSSNTAAPGSANLSASNSGTLTCSVTILTLTASATNSLTYAFAGPAGSLAGAGNTRTVSAPGIYTTTITGINGCTTTATATVVSNTLAPTLTVTPNSGTLTCNNPSVTLTASGTGTNYAWTGGTVGPTLVVSASGTYSVTATAANGCISMSAVSIITDQIQQVLAQPIFATNATAVCPGTNLTLAPTVPNNALSFQWFRNGQLISGGSPTLNLPNIQSGQAGSYVLVITGSCNSATSAAFNLTVNPEPDVVISFPNNATVQSSGGQALITIPASATGLTYQVFGGTYYKRYIVMLNLNGYQLQQVLDTTSGIFPIDQAGPYTINVVGANGCQRTVQGTINRAP